MSTKKKIMALAVTLAIAMIVVPFFATYANTNRQVTVTIDGQLVNFGDQGPIIVNNRVLVPVRGVFEHLGFEVTWDPSSRMARMVRDDMIIIVPAGAHSFVVDSSIITPDVPQQMTNNRLLLPLRAITDAMGGTSTWNSNNRVAQIVSAQASPTPSPQASPAPGISPAPGVSPTPGNSPLPGSSPLPGASPTPLPSASPLPGVSPSPGTSPTPAPSPMSQLPGASSTPSPDAPALVGTFRSVSGGLSNTLVITDDGGLWSFGNNFSGQIGDGTVSTTVTGADGQPVLPHLGEGPGNNDRTTPVRVMENVVTVTSAGSPPSFPGAANSRAYARSFAITQDGTLWGWGGGLWDWDELGMSSVSSGQIHPTPDHDTSRPYPIMDNVLDISATFSYAYVIKTDGSLWGWGLGYDEDFIGVLRDGSGIVHIMDDVIAVSAGFDHTLAITSDGVLWAWGQNYFGQVGDGTNINRNLPVPIMENIVAVSAGNRHSMAITADGDLYGWGLNRGGQVGDGTIEYRNYPVHVMYDVVSVSAGVARTLAITSDGRMWGWGSHMAGANGDIVQALTNPLHLMDNVAVICATNGSHLLAVTYDGELWAWGSNRYGQLGNGTRDNSLVFIHVKSDILVSYP